MNNYNFKESKENINLKGRCVVLNSSLYCAFTASGFEFKAEINGSLYVSIDLEGETGLIGIIIDNDYDKLQEIYLSKGEQKIEIAKNLLGTHTIRIVKLNEYKHNLLIINSFSFEGDLLEKPAEKKLKFDFYGDSLTCGYGNLCSTRATPAVHSYVQDGYKTWAALISRYYDADFTVAASSGQGILTDCTGNPKGIIDKYWDMCIPTRNIKWDFKNNIPDYVFINIGSNDINYYKFKNAMPQWDNYKIAFKKLVEGIRENAPMSKIVVAMGHDDSNEFYSQMISIYKSLIEEYDNFYVFDDLTSNQLGGDWHPNLDDHKMIFQKLKKHLTETFGEKL